MEIFTRKWSEMSGNSFCPEYYHYERDEVVKKLKEKYKNNLFALKNLVDFSSQKSTAKNVEKYIGMANIESNTSLYIDSNEDKGQGDCHLFNRGEILFNKLRPYLNKVYLAEFSGGCSTEFVVFKSKDEQKISNKFLSIFLFLDCVVNQTKHLMTGNTLPRLQTFDIENLLIPIPPKEIQEQIIDIMDNAYLEKKRKESEAQKILDSIDSFLLAELGINLLPKATSDLKKRIFFVKLSEISGNRFDCEYHQSYYKALEEAIQKGKYKVAKICNLIDNVKDLSQPFDKKVIYVEIGDIEVENAVVDLKTIPLEKLPSNTKICIKQGDLLISTVRPNRKAVAIYEKNNTAYCTSAFCVLRENGKYKKELLQYLLRTNIFNALIVRNTTGSTYPTINNNDILNLKIPLPPLSVQEKITDEITKRKQKALNLQKEAKECLNSAKIQVEKIILGQQQKDERV